MVTAKKIILKKMYWQELQEHHQGVSRKKNKRTIFSRLKAKLVKLHEQKKHGPQSAYSAFPRPKPPSNILKQGGNPKLPIFQYTFDRRHSNVTFHLFWAYADSFFSEVFLSLFEFWIFYRWLCGFVGFFVNREFRLLATSVKLGLSCGSEGQHLSISEGWRKSTSMNPWKDNLSQGKLWGTIIGDPPVKNGEEKTSYNEQCERQ